MELLSKSRFTCCQVLLALQLFNAQANQESVTDKVTQPLENRQIFAEGYPEAAPVTEQRLLFNQLDHHQFKLSGIKTREEIGFNSRTDEIITQLKLNFAYTPSPALLADLSHIKLYLNNELTYTFPVYQSDEQSDVYEGKIEKSVLLDPRLIKDYNQLRFELIGHYTMKCEDPFHSSIWAEIASSSTLELTRQRIALASELETFPEPFFDKRDYSRLTLPFMMHGTPSTEKISAAAIIASWFGAKANWRGAQFPLHQDIPLNGHSVVFASNENKPGFLADYPDVDGPTVEIIANPLNRYLKMLLVLGRDEKDLIQAAQGLVLGVPIMTGRTAQVADIQHFQPREAYDAPRWLPSNRSVEFAELVESPSALEVEGFDPRPINIDVRMPPDLFTWQSEGIPVELKYRYTPPVSLGESRLRMFINGQFSEAFTLKPDSRASEDSDSLFLPLFSSDHTEREAAFDVPTLKISAKNLLTFRFSFSAAKDQECQTLQSESTVGRIDEDSTIDISDFPHYIALPDLNAFSQGGFPYSKYADLRETLFVLTKQVNHKEIETLLAIAGHIGAITGYPGTHLTVTQDINHPDIENKDLILIGEVEQLITDAQVTQQLSAHISQQIRKIRRANKERPDYRFKDEKLKTTTQLDIISSGKLSVIMGFQSPYHPARSVLAITAASGENMQLAIDAITDAGKLNQLRGSIALIRKNGIESFHLGERYHIGSLPILTLIWYHMSGYPVLLAILSVITLLLLSFVVWRVLNGLVRSRLAKGEQS